MKRFFYNSVTILFVMVLVLQSCSTDFDLTSDWKDITTVYGLLNKDDDTTFIKINKAFLDQTTNALTIAQNPDSLYYENITASLEESDNSGFSVHIPLTRVDGNLIGHKKVSGVFTDSPNYLYMTTSPINPDRSYQLVIVNGDNGKTVTGSTEVINDFTISVPSPTVKVSFFHGRNYNVQWKSAKDGKVYGMIAHFHYKEFDISSNALLKDTVLDWTLLQNSLSSSLGGGETMSFGIPGDNFYTFVNSQVGDNPNVYRVAGNLDFVFSVAGQDYYTYTLVAEAHTGLTSGQIEPDFTNIDNGLGLFSSRTFKTLPNIGLDNRTIDSLACGHFTKHLGFRNSGGATCP